MTLADGIDDLVPRKIGVDDPYELRAMSLSDLVLLRDMVTIEIAGRCYRPSAIEGHEHRVIDLSKLRRRT